MKFAAALISVCLVLSLAACGGDDLSVELPGDGDNTLRLDFPSGQAVEHRLPFHVSGGVPPYESSIEGCPDWVTLFPDQGILAGMAPAEDRGKTYFCTYRVTEADPGFRPQRSVSYGLVLVVGSLQSLSLAEPGEAGKVSLSVGTFHNEAFPVANGGVSPYTYSFTCAGGSLPPGMGFAPATRRFAGTPDVRFRDSCTYSVTDSAQPAATVSVPVEVEVTGGATQPLGLPQLGKVSLSVGTFFDEAFSAANGGVRPYTYSFTCAGGSLPSGMGFAPATRRFTGTPDTRFRDSCTYSVTDRSQPAATVSVPVEVEVSSPVTGPLRLPRPDNGKVELAAGDFHNQAFPMATGGVPPYTYSFTCAGGSLPSGMGFAAATRTFAGTPDARFRDLCTYSVTDSAQPAATVSVDVEVEVSASATGPLRFLEPLPDQVGISIGTFYDQVFSEAIGGVQPYAYSLTCAGGSLPSGMGFAPETRRFAGTPGAPFRDSCTYSVTDNSQSAETYSVAVEIVATDLTLQSPGRVSLSVGVLHDLPFPQATGGVSPYTYSFACDGGSLPSGMGFAPETRRFAGTPGAPFRDSCTYSVKDSSQPNAAMVSVAVEVVVTDLMLATPSKVDLAVGTFREVEFREATGGVSPYTYSFTCAGGSLPSGMGFAPATRRFAGTPAARFRDSCTYSVTDSAQPAAMVSVPVEVEVTGGAGDLDLSPPDEKVKLTVGEFYNSPLPAATGGVKPYTYSFTCAGGALPSGMGFAVETRRFAGTPDARFRDSCTYSVTDSAQPAARVSVAVEVEVAGGAGKLELSGPGKVSLSVGTFREAEFQEATGGVQPYTYSFTCAGGSLPSGMGFAVETRRFAGTPDARFRDSCTYSVTDSAQPAARVSVAVEVEVAGGATPLRLTQVFEMIPGDELPPLKIGRRSVTKFGMASGGVAPYTYELADCTLPAGLEFHPSTRVLSGTPEEEYRGPNCTYRVTDSSSPPESVSLSFILIVEPLEENVWRFRTRTVEPGQGQCVVPNPENPLDVATLPAAHGGTGAVSYAVPGAPTPAQPGSFLSFDPDTRVLTYANPSPPPVLGTPNTYRYLVGTHKPPPDDNVIIWEDALCLDIQYDASEVAEVCPDNTYLHVHLRVRDDAFFDGNAQEYRCPDTAAPPPRSGAQGSLSNPVHSALAPVHARRAVDVAHGAVRDRVRGWSPGDPRLLSAFAPSIGIASPSGQSAGFDYSGSSESLSAGAELGAGFWQAGVVASFTRTELHYRAAANLAEYGYHAGEHDTEVFSLHPFAAWHIPSGGHFWASLGAGMGDLRHRDDVGFPSWSRSDVELRAHALGAAVPVAGVLSGELQAELGFESFAFEIEGGGRISSALPTLRGRDWRAGLAWSAPITGAPSVSVAYKRLTGDGPEGGQLEARGSVSVEGVFDPRLDLVGSAEGSFGLGDYEHDLWGLSGGIRFASGEERRGFGIHLDTRLESPDGGRALDPGMKGEAGYGLWSGSLLGTVRPYVGLARHSSDGSFRRALGIDLRETPDSRVKVEISDRPGDRLRALEFSVRHHF